MRAVQILAVLFTALSLVSSGARPTGSWAFAACVLLILSLGIFFIWTYPVNQVTGNWTKLPVNWQELRRQWEHSHVANAVITFASLVCATVSLAVAKR